MANRDEIKAIIGYLGMAYPNYKPDLSENKINTVDVMVDLLGDIPIESLRLAVKSCCAEPGQAFAPSAGEIRGKAVEIRTKIDPVPGAGEAWGEIIGSFERMPGGNMAGGGHSLILDHPLVQKAVRCMGGYASIGVDFFENQMANRAHFLRIYADLLNTWRDDAAELPQITEYIQMQRQIEGGIKMITDKMEVEL